MRVFARAALTRRAARGAGGGEKNWTRAISAVTRECDLLKFDDALCELRLLLPTGAWYIDFFR